jgi:hypothetical protein
LNHLPCIGFRRHILSPDKRKRGGDEDQGKSVNDDRAAVYAEPIQDRKGSKPKQSTSSQPMQQQPAMTPAATTAAAKRSVIHVTLSMLYPMINPRLSARPDHCLPDSCLFLRSKVTKPAYCLPGCKVSWANSSVNIFNSFCQSFQGYSLRLDCGQSSHSENLLVILA